MVLPPRTLSLRKNMAATLKPHKRATSGGSGVKGQGSGGKERLFFEDDSASFSVGFLRVFFVSFFFFFIRFFLCLFIIFFLISLSFVSAFFFCT